MSRFSRSLQPGSPFFSQAGEDVIAWRLLREMGIRSQTAVEFGATDGRYKSNTAYFKETLHWRVWMFDSEPRLVKGSDGIHGVYSETITAENVNDIFQLYAVPDDLDLLSIDIDGNDLWVWKALRYQPQVVIIEYNPKWRPARKRTVPYDASREWDRTDYYGASAGALVALGKEKGYALANFTEYNLIFAVAGSVDPLPVSRVKHRTRSDRPDPLERPWVGYP